MRIISLGRFWAVNHVACFCHVVVQMIMMNEMILWYGATHTLLIASKQFFIHKTLDMDGSALKHFKHPDCKNALERTPRCHMHAFIFLT